MSARCRCAAGSSRPRSAGPAFVLPTIVVNNSFAQRDWRLLWIDGGHWLVVLLLMGAIIGAMGV